MGQGGVLPGFWGDGLAYNGVGGFCIYLYERLHVCVWTFMGVHIYVEARA